MFTVTHNGYKVEPFTTYMEVENYISSVLSEHADLSPKEYVSVTVRHNCKILVYKYSTLYCEMFMIERRENL